MICIACIFGASSMAHFSFSRTRYMYNCIFFPFYAILNCEFYGISLGEPLSVTFAYKNKP